MIKILVINVNNITSNEAIFIKVYSKIWLSFLQNEYEIDKCAIQK